MDVTGYQPPQNGVALTLYTNSMQKGYTLLQQPSAPKNELLAVSREIERNAMAVGKEDDPNVKKLMDDLGKLIPKTAGGWS